MALRILQSLTASQVTSTGPEKGCYNMSGSFSARASRRLYWLHSGDRGLVDWDREADHLEGEDAPRTTRRYDVMRGAMRGGEMPWDASRGERHRVAALCAAPGVV